MVWETIEVLTALLVGDLAYLPTRVCIDLCHRSREMLMCRYGCYRW
jgi:hypothetical protein